MVNIKVADYHTRCGVRAKGKEFHNSLLEILPKGDKDIRFDFEGVSFVSASFLEESIFKFIDDYNVSIVERTSGLKAKAENIITWNDLKIDLIEDDDILVFSSL